MALLRAMQILKTNRKEGRLRVLEFITKTPVLQRHHSSSTD